ncbi:hypothetical protein G3R49_16765 [Shewanella sp. WXL01]|uniref:Lipoprotein n=1 Tax=Shewanella maritima TaxID=2520507 RepID=A0A411PIV4_9GAMM|nr:MULTISPECIES: hypothetical protein [Shewanella]NKF52216.1 hypothetical protein [Shewanella sp. WXL01]QBF83473.1 hypothetical protein EXU30_12780 [Shewanella maritima]
MKQFASTPDNARTQWLSKLTLGVVIAGLVSLSGCIRTPEWTLFYAGDEQQAPAQYLEQKFIAGYYDTVEQCQAKGRGLVKLKMSKLPLEQAYVCGHQCQTDDSGNMRCQQLVEASAFDGI